MLRCSGASERARVNHSGTLADVIGPLFAAPTNSVHHSAACLAMVTGMALSTLAALDDTTVGTGAVGNRQVRRMGFGGMRISGARTAEGLRDRGLAVELVLGVRDRGVQYFDTANIYGYGQSEEILASALAPYADDLLIATKAGFAPGKLAPGQRSLPPNGRPEHIREECDKSLRRLRIECIDLYFAHVPDPAVPWADTVGTFAEL